MGKVFHSYNILVYVQLRVMEGRLECVCWYLNSYRAGYKKTLRDLSLRCCCLSLLIVHTQCLHCILMDISIAKVLTKVTKTNIIESYDMYLHKRRSPMVIKLVEMCISQFSEKRKAEREGPGREVGLPWNALSP